MVDWVTVILAKKEATYGTDAAPTVAANAVLTRNFSAKPIDVDQIDRNLDMPNYGAFPGGPSNERRTSSYEVEIAGSGAAGTAPGWMELLEGCGMAAATLNAGVSAVQTFAPAGASVSSLTHYDFLTDQRRKMAGSVGSFSFDFTAGTYPYFGFNWTGLVPAATPFDKTAPGAATLTRWKAPVEVNNANTTFALDGYAAKLRSWKGDANVQTALRSLVGSRYVRRGNHKLTSTVMIEAPDIATKDYIQTLRAGSLIAVSMVHGTVAGNIVELGATKVQVTEIAESKEDDIVMWTLTLLHTIDTTGAAQDLTITAR